ncbi:bifunctional phosphopantothenoylcysteine decarboxylase/phosphopantothenate--cysteine ligase CoaBC [Leptolinea tardivitalis]|uniref:Coenzyme A biosynthesis bifunctional protein CoaBC n=1 Tax=Leptolinea tardivitalis TaxID=229920 RepID=A0A0P6X0B8_9CHLR|nr:bifunctional phosphopantothenoylcysteine decarboxylase/phosphopantothenate--cysteine ligase CoaBC [Leptolinea tardivitalis]KPL72592.1 phosphopantothenoylcysteine decarboxylase [Leptolinea tardivitalis]GAP21096.1 phosphopantothenate-cysteine ligase [Leptolinea tardivitalis]
MTNPLQDKHIILGVTGSIAAYKAVEIASKLTQNGAIVDVVLTESACKFVSPLTFQSVTGRKASTEADLWGGEGHVVHVSLGHKADLVLITPISANTLAKLATGIADNLLTVTVLASSAPLIIAPAMDVDMYQKPITQENVEKLRQRGAIIVGPESGHLASGLVGPGRMSEPVEIVNMARYVLSRGGRLEGRKVVVTAGGTSEPIDPVRVITNRSSGKQGYALAQAALDMGCDVTLISTTDHLMTPAGANLVHVDTAQQMMEAVINHTDQADLLIMAAAVADFRPFHPADEKIKKEDGVPAINLEKTPDILKEIANIREKTGFPRRVIGFAAETEALVENARRKIKQKRLDMIAANDISTSDAGFEVDTNRVVLLFPDGSSQELGLQTKLEAAQSILNKAASWFEKV